MRIIPTLYANNSGYLSRKAVNRVVGIDEIYDEVAPLSLGVVLAEGSSREMAFRRRRVG